MGALVDLVFVPLLGAVVGGMLAGPWGVFLGLVGGLYAGATRGRGGGDDRRVADLERRLDEKEERIADLERRLDGSADE